jgi:proteasome lid subunit RPN8/RPN11
VALVLSRASRARVRALSRSAWPREACGLLIGRTAGARTEVRRVVGAPNLAHGEGRFELDPGAVVAAENEARRAGLALVGAWHSHPARPPRPSEADRHGAWPGWTQLIVALDARGRAELRAWRPDGAAWVEVPIVR